VGERTKLYPVKKSDEKAVSQSTKKGHGCVTKEVPGAQETQMDQVITEQAKKSIKGSCQIPDKALFPESVDHSSRSV